MQPTIGQDDAELGKNDVIAAISDALGVGEQTAPKFKNPREILNEFLDICERERLFCGTNCNGLPMMLNNILDAVKSIRSLPSDSDLRNPKKTNEYYEYP